MAKVDLLEENEKLNSDFKKFVEDLGNGSLLSCLWEIEGSYRYFGALLSRAIEYGIEIGKEEE